MKELEEYRVYTKTAEVHKAVNMLKGILQGIEFDQKVIQAEIDEVIHWCNTYRHFGNKHPFNEIFYVLDNALLDDHLSPEEIKDILWVCNNLDYKNKKNQYYDVITSSIQELQGILHGIMADSILNENEVNRLFEWMQNNEHLKGTYPFDEIYSLIIATRSDGVISKDELNLLKAYFSNFIDFKTSYNTSEDEINELKKQYSIGGICSIDPHIEIVERTFCFTGTSNRATRKEIADVIINYGGKFNNNVTSKTEYLIVGNAGNPCWAFACYGRKVEKAIELRKNGSSIIIVNENDFWDLLHN